MITVAYAVATLAVLGALTTSLLEAAAQLGLPVSFVKHLPFSTFGFGWVVPSLLGALIGAWRFEKE